LACLTGRFTAQIKIFSDHLNLQYWRSPQKISRRIAREVLELSSTTSKFTILGKRERESRRVVHDGKLRPRDRDNEGVTVLPITSSFAQCPSERPRRRLISNERCRIGQPGLRPKRRHPTWLGRCTSTQETTGTWYKDGRRVVTGGIHDKSTLIRAHHDAPVYGHPGIKRTIQLVERFYWWPGLRQDTLDYVKGCANVNDTKSIPVHTRTTISHLSEPHAYPSRLLPSTSLRKLPISQGYNSVLTITDHDCSKASIFIPCNEEITAEGTAALYVTHVFPRFGLPSRLSAIGDPRFVSHIMRASVQL